MNRNGREGFIHAGHHKVEKKQNAGIKKVAV